MSRRTSAFSTLSKYSRALAAPPSSPPMAAQTSSKIASRALGARLLLVDRERLHDLGGRHLADLGLEDRVGPGLGVEGPARLARLPRQVLLDPRQPLAFLVAEGQRLEHLLLADLAPAGLHHEDGVLGAGDHQLERGGRELLVGRIGHEPPVDERDANGSDRSQERYARQRHRSRGAHHGQHVRIVLVVRGEHEVDDLQLVAEALGEQRTERPIDQAAGERLLLVRTAFALEESAGDPAARRRRVSRYSTVSGRKSRSRPSMGVLAATTVDSTMVPPDAHDDGAVGLLGDLPGLDREPCVIDLGLHRVGHTISDLQRG